MDDYTMRALLYAEQAKMASKLLKPDLTAHERAYLMTMWKQMEDSMKTYPRNNMDTSLTGMAGSHSHTVSGWDSNMHINATTSATFHPQRVGVQPPEIRLFDIVTAFANRYDDPRLGYLNYVQINEGMELIHGWQTGTWAGVTHRMYTLGYRNWSYHSPTISTNTQLAAQFFKVDEHEPFMTSKLSSEIVRGLDYTVVQADEMDTMIQHGPVEAVRRKLQHK